MRISDWSSDVCSSDLRKVKKRSFRALWIQRINAAVRAEGLTYSQFMHGVKLAGIELDRKVMADLAMNEGGVFTAIIAQAKAALPKAACSFQTAHEKGRPRRGPPFSLECPHTTGSRHRPPHPFQSHAGASNIEIGKARSRARGVQKA